MGTFDLLGHAVLFFFSGLTFWLMQAGRHNLGTILSITLLVIGVYFLGWWALITFILGVFQAARIFTKAVQSGKDPFKNPWKQE